MQQFGYKMKAPMHQTNYKHQKVQEILCQIDTSGHKFCTNFPSNSSFGKKVPKSISDSYTLCFPANSCKSCPKIVKMACQQAVYEQSNPVRTEQSLRYNRHFQPSTSYLTEDKHKKPFLLINSCHNTCLSSKVNLYRFTGLARDLLKDGPSGGRGEK